MKNANLLPAAEMLVLTVALGLVVWAVLLVPHVTQALATIGWNAWKAL